MTSLARKKKKRHPARGKAKAIEHDGRVVILGSREPGHTVSLGLGT